MGLAGHHGQHVRQLGPGLDRGNHRGHRGERSGVSLGCGRLEGVRRTLPDQGLKGLVVQKRQDAREGGRLDQIGRLVDQVA